MSTMLRAGFVWCVLGLAGCERAAVPADLQLWLAAARTDPAPRPMLAAPPPPVTATSMATVVGAVDPFDPTNLYPTARSPSTHTSDTSNTDTVRAQSPLEKYSLEQFQLVGLMRQQTRRWAIIHAPDNTIHRLTLGDYIGSRQGRHGRVIVIGDGHVQIQEINPTNDASSDASDDSSQPQWQPRTIEWVLSK